MHRSLCVALLSLVKLLLQIVLDLLHLVLYGVTFLLGLSHQCKLLKQVQGLCLDLVEGACQLEGTDGESSNESLLNSSIDGVPG